MLRFLNNEKGGTLMVALMLALMLGMLGIMAVNNSNTDLDLSFNNQNTENSFYIAEAGAKRAFAQLNSTPGWDSGYVSVSYNKGAYSVLYIDSLADSTLADTVILQSTGTINGSVSTVDLSLIPEYLYPFQFAMFAGKGISLDRNTCTDSFNSDSGTYAATQLDSMGDVGSNGTITSSKDVNFGGGIESATPGGINLGINNTVNGDSTSTADTVVLDLIPQSEFDWAESNSNAMSGISGSNFNYNNGTKKLSLGSSGSVTLQSGVYFFSEIYLDQDSEIILAPGASVQIYVTGDMTYSQNSTTNVGGNASDFMVWSQGDLNFNQGNSFTGTFYSPTGHIQYDQTTEVYGALVSNTIQLDKGACFHYDRSLGSLQYGTTGLFEIIAWSEE